MTKVFDFVKNRKYVKRNTEKYIFEPSFARQRFRLCKKINLNLIQVRLVLSLPSFTGLVIAKKNYPPSTGNIQRITFWKNSTNRLKCCPFRSQILTERFTASRLLLTKLWLDLN